MRLDYSDHEGIQTPDRWSRNPVLYSAELRGQLFCECSIVFYKNTK